MVVNVFCFLNFIWFLDKCELVPNVVFVSKVQLIYFYFYFLLELCKCSATFGEKRPWQYIAVICTTDVWDHIIFFSQYDVAAPPEPNILYFHTHTHPYYIILYFLLQRSCPSSAGKSSNLELSWDDNSCRGAQAMIGIGRGNLRHSNSYQYLKGRKSVEES